MKQKPDSAARLAERWFPMSRWDTGEEDEENHRRRVRLTRKVRSLIRREVKAERERMIALAEAQRHYELVHHLTRAGAFALDDLIDKMKGPK